MAGDYWMVALIELWIVRHSKMRGKSIYISDGWIGHRHILELLDSSLRS